MVEHTRRWHIAPRRWLCWCPVTIMSGSTFTLFSHLPPQRFWVRLVGSPQSPDRLVHGLGDWVERGLPLPVSPFGSATLTTKSWGCSSGGRPLHRSRGLQWHQWCLLEAARQHSPVSPPVRLLLFIDLLLRAVLPSSCLYSLSKPKREAMERYPSELLATGLIRPLLSLVGSGFFFVKKDSSLRPCIDY